MNNNTALERVVLGYSRTPFHLENFYTKYFVSVITTCYLRFYSFGQEIFGLTLIINLLPTSGLL
jgi:hypothetical protein